MASSELLSVTLALWGAVLSTTLAGLKIAEEIRKGPRLTSSYNLSSGENGSLFVLENPSPAPVMITYWELYWARRKGFWVKITEPEAFPNVGYCNITVAPHGRHEIEVGNIRWGAKHADKGQLWLKLYVSGRRSASWIKVYDPAV